jgi:hypothetical protein
MEEGRGTQRSRQAPVLRPANENRDYHADSIPTQGPSQRGELTHQKPTRNSIRCLT